MTHGVVRSERPATGDDGSAMSTGDAMPTGDANATGDAIANGDDGGVAARDDGGSAGDDAAAESDCGPPAADPSAAPAGPMVPDVTLCSPYPNPAAGMATGSGIDPDYAVTCEPTLMFCVLAKEPPSLR